MSCPWRLGPSASPPHCCIAGCLLYLMAPVGPCKLLLLACVVSRWFGLLWFAIACFGVVLFMHALASLRGVDADRATLRSASRG
jgi:hypothetical protein